MQLNWIFSAETILAREHLYGTHSSIARIGMGLLFLPHSSDRQTFAAFKTPPGGNERTHSWIHATSYPPSATSNHISPTLEVTKDRNAMSTLTSLMWQLHVCAYTHRPRDHMANQMTCFTWVGSLISMDSSVNSSIISVTTTPPSSPCLFWDEWIQLRMKDPVWIFNTRMWKGSDQHPNDVRPCQGLWWSSACILKETMQMCSLRSLKEIFAIHSGHF